MTPAPPHEGETLIVWELNGRKGVAIVIRAGKFAFTSVGLNESGTYGRRLTENTDYSTTPRLGFWCRPSDCIGQH